MIVNYPNVPVAAIPLLAGQLRDHGALVRFDEQNPGSGLVRHESGTFSFTHRADLVLSVTILHTAGHFPRLMLIGGIRQLVEEAIERLQAADDSDRGSSVSHGTTAGS